jgi:general secretion pathway protein B
MSFILDALRKSEHERQRAATPGIANVPFGAPRKVLPVWAIALIVVLAIAVLGLGGAYLRSEWSAGARQARVTSRAETPVALSGSAPRAGLASERPAAPSERPGQLTERPLARESGRSIPPAPQSSLRGAPTSSPSTLAAPASADRTEEPRFARAERAAEPAGKSGPVLPSAASLEAEGIAVPKLTLQLVAFYDSPAERYVFINNARYKEGATLAEGPRVLSITTNGAVLSYLGREFMLTQ